MRDGTFYSSLVSFDRGLNYDTMTLNSLATGVRSINYCRYDDKRFKPTNLSASPPIDCTAGSAASQCGTQCGMTDRYGGGVLICGVSDQVDEWALAASSGRARRTAPVHEGNALPSLQTPPTGHGRQERVRPDPLNLTPQVNPGSHYRCCKSAQERTPCTLSRSEKTTQVIPGVPISPVL